MILLTNENDNIIGFQLAPETTNARHVVFDINVSVARKIIGRSSVSELNDIESLMARIESEDVAKQKESARIEAKTARDSALQSMVYDFGDGRVMQTRPQDEVNIIAAIELIESEGLGTVGWIMADNTKHAVTADELRAALRSGRLQGLAIWDGYGA